MSHWRWSQRSPSWARATSSIRHIGGDCEKRNIEVVELICEANGLLNTGFETEGPEVLIPKRAAEALDLWPELPDGALRDR